MVRVTVDTSKDSQEEILKAIEFLRSFTGSSESMPEDNPVPMGMFDTEESAPSKISEPESGLPEDIKVLEY